ncbi:helix-turn-helix domain-containing protein [Aestuariicella hydrocarbonica]|uniref:Helix-turn-helix domain-containing protein n=1 Tax=Pseudomaricurvus hydrocarbonicus TaxID=1470433 RepID=A0A9E5T4E2_9GAMM|nr:helix-turn-helix domain-containing protein [Aestuariicella hydrocarbonica]NHO68013.1 helix-turn-helix domain-containing protein [Aestuariicella hydrocarbonica]
MPTITIAVYDGCRASSFTNFLDMLDIANLQWQKRYDTSETLFRWKLASGDGKPIRTATHIRMAVDSTFQDAEPSDVVMVAAAQYGNKQAFPEFLKRQRLLIQWLKQRSDQGAMLLTLCTGTFLVAETGILNNQRATTTWWQADLFRARYPSVTLDVDQLLIQSDNFMIAGAGNTDSLMALKLIERYMGHQIASLTSKLMLVDNNQVEQTPYLTLQQQLQHNDSLVADAQTWLQIHMKEPGALDKLAEHLNVSSRTLIRRFKQVMEVTPNRYLQNLRIDTAKRLLETSGNSIEAIMLQVGYNDLSSFSRLFQRKTGLTPRAYRARFQYPNSGHSPQINALHA